MKRTSNSTVVTMQAEHYQSLVGSTHPKTIPSSSRRTMIQRTTSLTKLAALCTVIFALVATVSADTVIFQGLEYSSVGNATLQIVNDTLVVSNIGPSGSDGVSLHFPSGTISSDIELAPFVNMPVGSFLEHTTFGLGSDQPISTARSTAIEGGGVAATFTYPGQETLNASFYLGGVLLGTEVVPNGGIFLQADPGITHRDVLSGGVVIKGTDQEYGFNVFTPDDEMFVVDDYRLSAPAPSWLTGLSSASFTAGGGITSFTIVGEQLETVPEPGSLALLGTGIAGLAGLLRRKSLG